MCADFHHILITRLFKLWFPNLKTGKPINLVKRGGNKLQIDIRQEELSFMRAPMLCGCTLIMFELSILGIEVQMITAISAQK